MTAVGISEDTEYRKNIYGIDEPIEESDEKNIDAGNDGNEENTGIKRGIDPSGNGKNIGAGSDGNEENAGVKRGIDPSILDVIIVPLVAFDGDRNRLGRGKGYYDKFLAKTDAVKIGAAYKAAEVGKIDADRHDVKMDIIVTEK
jgi:hypothetical protein